MRKKPISKLNMPIVIVLVVMMTLSISVFIGRIMDFNELKKEEAAIDRNIKSRQEEIEELEHRFNAPMDDEYIESVAKAELDLINPDEIIVHNNIND